MSTILVTGGTGTIGIALIEFLHQKKHSVYTWNRREIPVNDYNRMETFIEEINPDILFHLAVPSTPSGMENEDWLVNYQWTSELAWLTRTHKITFIYTSTVVVFSDETQGPYTEVDTPDRQEGYGYSKRMAEERVLYQNPDAYICRLGWQIDSRQDSNNMFAHLCQESLKGKISASTHWIPSCSFLEDTVKTLFSIRRKRPGIYMVNANKKWSYFEIATALKEHFQTDWQIIPTEDFVLDQRMFDERIRITGIEERLPELERRVPFSGTREFRVGLDDLDVEN